MVDVSCVTTIFANTSNVTSSEPPCLTVVASNEPVNSCLLPENVEDPVTSNQPLSILIGLPNLSNPKYEVSAILCYFQNTTKCL